MITLILFSRTTVRTTVYAVLTIFKHDSAVIALTMMTRTHKELSTVPLAVQWPVIALMNLIEVILSTVVHVIHQQQPLPPQLLLLPQRRNHGVLDPSTFVSHPIQEFPLRTENQ